jgi:hypothetical protein
VTWWRGTANERHDIAIECESIFNFHSHLKILTTPLTSMCDRISYETDSGNISLKKGLKRPAGEARYSHRNCGQVSYIVISQHRSLMFMVLYILVTYMFSSRSN